MLTRAHERLREELADDGVLLPGTPQQVEWLLRELDYARRPPVHEGRAPMYGSFILPERTSLVASDDLADLVDLDLPLDECRRFADGRSTFLAHHPDGRPQLACFRRSVQYEAELVELQRGTGALIVQRTVMGTARVFGPAGVIEWSGHEWTLRPSARAHLPSVLTAVPEADRDLIGGILDLCVHWLSPAHIGATFLLDVDPRDGDEDGLDRSAAHPVPALSIGSAHHYPALFAMLMQTDLATLVRCDGLVTSTGVGLWSSADAERAVDGWRGMRHRSAARYTWDHHHTVAFVVSADGPVTVFRRGAPVAVCTDPCR